MSISSPPLRPDLDGLRTLVLNADGGPIAVISWKRAICLVYEGKVIMMEFYRDVAARDGRGISHPIPAVAMIRKYVRRKTHRATLNRTNLLIRDSYRCRYCGVGGRAGDLTIDHVTPRSRWVGGGSPTCWENVVVSCQGCNKKKGDRTCQEANMFPSVVPFAPSYAEVLLGTDPRKGRFPPEWAAYLSGSSPITHERSTSHEVSISESPEAGVGQR